MTTHMVVTVLEPTPFGQTRTTDCADISWLEDYYIGSYTCKCLTTGEWDFAHCGYWRDFCKRACPDDKDAKSANGISLNADWPSIAGGETATLQCPDGYTGSVSRWCNTESRPKWEAVEGECVAQDTVC